MGRSRHIATCLGYGGQHKAVLISGGLGVNIITLDDLWLLDLESGRCEEVSELFGKGVKLLRHYL